MDIEIIRSVGTIIKKEKLASVEHETYTKALVLESLQPYPGYHGTTIPDRLEPDSLFAVTKQDYYDEEIIRSIQKVKKVCKIKFDGAPGTIFVENNAVNVIRFKGLNYNMIGEIIENFENAGIGFKKYKKIAPYYSLIKIRKFFNLKKLDKYIYEDLDVKEFFYLSVPKYPDWDVFEEITKSIKYNIEDLVFDAAQLSVYDSSGLVDFVRIYDSNRFIDKLSLIRKHYLEAYNRL